MNYPIKKQVEIFIKLYYTQNYITVAKELKITISKVKTIEKHALRYIRLAYSKSYIQYKKFDGKLVLQHMAERSRLTTQELTDIFDLYITESVSLGYQPYFDLIEYKDKNLTAAELLEFIYMKYEFKLLRKRSH